jgi:hypothetical protein
MGSLSMQGRDATAACPRRWASGAVNWELAMNKCLPIVGLALVASVTACEYKEQRTVQQPAPAAAVMATTPAPAGSVVYTPPAPATTTVYTTR